MNCELVTGNQYFANLDVVFCISATSNSVPNQFIRAKNGIQQLVIVFQINSFELEFQRIETLKVIYKLKIICTFIQFSNTQFKTPGNYEQM
jgi:hypothetical protein